MKQGTLGRNRLAGSIRTGGHIEHQHDGSQEMERLGSGMRGRVGGPDRRLLALQAPLHVEASRPHARRIVAPDLALIARYRHVADAPKHLPLFRHRPSCASRLSQKFSKVDFAEEWSPPCL